MGVDDKARQPWFEAIIRFCATEGKMMSPVIEAFTFSKSGDEHLNEDTFMVGDDMIGVFDGETNKGTHTEPTPGRCAAVALADTVKTLTTGTAPAEIVSRLHDAVAAVRVNDVSAAAVGVVVDMGARRIVRVGDVAVSINGAFDMGHKRVDTVAAACRAALLQSMLDDGATICDLQASNDPGREMILPLLRAQAVWRNQPQSRVRVRVVGRHRNTRRDDRRVRRATRSGGRDRHGRLHRTVFNAGVQRTNVS